MSSLPSSLRNRRLSRAALREIFRRKTPALTRTAENSREPRVLFAARLKTRVVRDRERIDVDCLNDLLSSISITSRRRCPGEIVLRLVHRSANTYAPAGIYDGTGIFYYVPRDRHLPRDIYATVAGRKRRALEVERKQRGERVVSV